MVYKMMQKIGKSTHKFRFKRFCVTLILLLIFTLTQISFVSGFTIDDIKPYDEDKKEYTLINAWGYGEHIATLKLNTPEIFNVGLGYQKVAEIQITNGESDYENILKQMQFYNINEGMKEFEREFDYKYKIVEQVDVEVYDENICKDKLNFNGTIEKYDCFKTEKRDKISWELFTRNSLLKEEEITIGIFTTTYEGDYVEWIPTVYGNERLTKWAIWTASIEVDLVSWYTLDELSGIIAEDIIGTNDGDANNARVFTAETGGILNTSADFTQGDDFINLTDSPWDDVFAGDFSVSMWIYFNNVLNDERFISKWYDGSARVFELAVDGSGKLLLVHTSGIGGDTLEDEGSVLNAGEWYHIVLIKDGVGKTVYLNNSINITVATTQTSTNNIPLVLGARSTNTGIISFADVLIDEVGIWERAITVAEVEQLFADGLALNPISEFGIGIIFPVDSTTYDFAISDLNYTFKSTTPADSCWNSLNGGATNSSEVTAGTNFTGLTSTEGSNTWTVYCNNTDNDLEMDSVTFIVDTTPPLVNITSPQSVVNFSKVGGNLTLSWVIIESDIDTIYYNYDGTNETVTGLISSTEFTIESFENRNLTFFVNDTLGNENITFIEWEYKLFKINESYVNSTTSGATNKFEINFETNGVAITQAYLHYNNTKLLGSITSNGNVYTLIRNQIAPGVLTPTNISFYWNITRSDSFNYLTNLQNQTVSAITINNSCGAGMYLIYNLTLVDERTQKKISETIYNSSIKIDLNLYTLDRTILLSRYYKDFKETNPVSICMDSNLTGGEIYSLDLQIEYRATNYSIEKYNIKEQILSSSSLYQSIYLYDLDTDHAQEFKLIVRDSAYNSIGDALVRIERKYIENGTFYVTEIPKTDGTGITSASLEVDDVIYNFHIYRGSVLLSSFINVIAICQTPSLSECEIDFNAYQAGMEIPDYETADNFNFTLDYNSTSKVITSQFIVLDGNPAVTKLEVIREDALGTAICEDTLLSASGTLSCVIPASFGNSTVRVNLYKDGERIGWGTVKVDQNPSDIYGVILTMISLFVLMTLIGMAISDNPIITGVFLLVGMILMMSMNLIASTGFLGATATFLFLVIAIVLVLIKAARRS